MQRPDNKRTQEGPRVNHQITAEKIRLIGSEGEMMGVLTRSEALRAAKDVGLDLIEISPNAEPPVCKISDYGKYKYEQQKKKAEAKKNQKVVEVKEIQMRPMIDPHDLEIKCNAIRRFLDEGNKVKILMRFRGRELAHQEIGMDILIRVKALFEELVRIEVQPRLEGRQMTMIIAPK